MKRVVILGAGGHALVVIDILRYSTDVQIVGCIADGADSLTDVAGVPLLGSMDRLESLHREGLAVAMGVGGWTDTVGRRRIHERAASAGVEIISAIHPGAHVSPSAKVDPGCVIFAGAVVNPGASLGRNVVVATNSSIDHETTIGDHTLISAGVTIGANCRIDSDCLVAIGATVASRITIGRNSLVGAGAVVVGDVAENASVIGVPARQR